MPSSHFSSLVNLCSEHDYQLVSLEPAAARIEAGDTNFQFTPIAIFAILAGRSGAG